MTPAGVEGEHPRTEERHLPLLGAGPHTDHRQLELTNLS